MKHTISLYISDIFKKSGGSPMEGKIKMSPRVFLRGMSTNLYQFCNQMFDTYGELFTLQVGKYTIHFFLSPTHIKHILYNNAENYARDSRHLGIANDLVGEYGLFNTDNYDLWKKDRKTFNPIFSQENIEKFIPLMADVTEQHLDTWNEFAIDDKPFNIATAITHITLSNVLKIFFSDAQFDLDDVINISRNVGYLSIKSGTAQGKLLSVLPSPMYFKIKQAKREFTALGHQLVDYCLKADSDNLVKTLARAYSDKNGKLNTPIKHLVQEALTFLVAGHESVSATLSWACIYMSLYPHIQQVMHEEIVNAIGKRKPTIADFTQLPYIRSVFQEVLRLQTPALFLLKHAVKNDMIGRLEIKKDDLVIIPSYHIHRMSRYWTNPEGFDPSRFSKPLGEEYNNIYLPFGGGPRSCIGRNFAMIEATIILAMIIQRFKLYLKSGSIVQQDMSLINRPRTDILMTVHPYA